MTAEQRWKKHANQTARKINLGWWLQILATPLLITCLITACGILFARRELDTPSIQELSIISAIIIFIIGVICLLLARSRFEKPEESLVRIEAKMKLQNALTAAKHGLAKWPEVPSTVNDGVQWQWQRLLPPILGAALILACGFMIPIQAKSDQQADQQPHAWSELESSLALLENEEIVQEEYLDETRKKLEELREQSPEEWFGHSSLEATDNLLRNHDSEQEALKNNLQRAEQSLQGLQNQSANMSAQQKQQLMNEFDQALKKMEQGAMKPNEELLKQLKKLDPNQLQNLNQEQLDQLRENMRKLAEQLKQNKGNEPGEGDQEGEGKGEEEGDGKYGTGGINKGPGHAPNPLGKEKNDTGAGKYESLQSDNQENALPGDLLETSDAEHDVDKSPRGPTDGGTTESQGQGGDRVWKNSLLPEEKKALKKFFE